MKKNLSIKWLVVKNGIEKFLIKNFENILNDNLLTNWKCEYNTIRNIILLSDVIVNVQKFIKQTIFS